MRTGVGLLLAVAVACGGRRAPQMYPAGSDKDDGSGDLAQKSALLLLNDKPDGSLFEPGDRHRRTAEGHGDPYGGNPYGGAMYGGAASGAVAPLSAGVAPAPRAPRYQPTSGLTGAVEGTVSWRGAPPARLTTACGSFAEAGVRVGADRAAGGVLVYIERVETGRPLPTYGRAVSVGGVIAKRGCMLVPAVQIVTPLPASLAIHGDRAAATLRITQPSGTQPFELQAAGRVTLQAQLGITRVESDDGSLAAAWVVAADTPYYAITDDHGRFRLDELAAGRYDVAFWRPPLAALDHGKLSYGAPVVVRRTVTVDPARPARLDIALER